MMRWILAGSVISMAAGAPMAAADVLDPIDVASVRYWNQGACGGLCELTGMSVRWGDAPSPGFEDRTVLLFDLSAYPDPAEITSATLDLGIQDQDPGPPVGIIDIYSEKTDIDEIPLEAFFAGEYQQSFEFDLENALIHVDVTEILQSAVLESDPNLLFRLSTITSDRFLLGPIIGQPDPTLTIVPEPSACVLLLACATWMLRRPLVRPKS